MTLSHDLEQAIAARAADADRGESTLRLDLADLADAGLCEAPVPLRLGGAGLGTEPEGTVACLDVLRALGRANLSVARLYEGHVNALKLIALHGSRDQQREAAESARRGRWFGVWGADADRPVSLEPAQGALRLSGAKRFASGLGLVVRAVVTARHEGRQQLVVAPVDDPGRQDNSGWRTSGMRATRSGTYDFDGLELPRYALLGEPDVFTREPHFEGGTWRYCAAHLGGAEAVYGAMSEMLAESGRAAEPRQAARIAHAAIAVETARLWVESTARRVEAADAPPEAAAYALLAREAVERCCVEVMDLADRALGTVAHFETIPVERMCRDLRFFLRQAALDAKLAKAAAALSDRRCRPEDL